MSHTSNLKASKRSIGNWQRRDAACGDAVTSGVEHTLLESNAKHWETKMHVERT